MMEEPTVNTTRVCHGLSVLCLVIAVLILLVPIPAWSVLVFVLLAGIFYLLPGVLA